MVGETMVGHDQYNAIPEGEEFPLWQGKNKDWEPVRDHCVYFSPDGQFQEKVGIFCTAVNAGRRYKKGQKWKTHDEVRLGGGKGCGARSPGYGRGHRCQAQGQGRALERGAEADGSDSD